MGSVPGEGALRVAVVIPTLNEAGSIRAVIGALPPVERVVVVDSGSVDGTPDAARAAGAEVIREAKRGYGTAVLAGLRALASDPPDVVVILDADHADRPDLLERLLAPIRHGDADLVLSDRTRTAEPGALTLQQRVGNRLATTLIRLTTGHRYRDLGPFRAIRWESLAALGMVDPTWGWNVEMQSKAVRAGLRIVEVEMPYRARQAGSSKISGSVRGSLRAGGRMVLAVWRYR